MFKNRSTLDKPLYNSNTDKTKENRLKLYDKEKGFSETFMTKVNEKKKDRMSLI